jgi:quercetin dioxygenase-like cupin family protein
MKYFTLLLVSLFIFSCSIESKTENVESEFSSFFKNGDIMTSATQDPLGNVFSYPTGEAAVTSQVKVWEPGFKSPWHYHPYTGVAYVVQGELTVNYDTDTSLDDIDSEKTIVSSETYKAGDKAFLGVANTWHLSENNGSEDLIFIVSWLGEKDKPLAVLSK